MTIFNPRFLVLILLAACSKPTEEPIVPSFDVEITRTSPFSTWRLVTPGLSGADLPNLTQINSQEFAKHFRTQSGCSVDTSPDIYVLGDERVPAGYMVPVVCP